MAGADLDLMPGEKMVLSSHPHWFYFWKQVAAGVGILALLFLMLQIDDGALDTVVGWLTLLAFVVLIVNAVYAYIGWKTTRFAITDQRVAYQTGIFRRRGVSIPLNRINNVNFNQSLIARTLNNGVVTIESAGETGDSVFENIPDPQHVRAVIFQEVEADESADSDRDAAALAQALKDHSTNLAPPTAGKSPQERLKALDDLRAQGLVSDAEFEVKRQQILEDL